MKTKKLLSILFSVVLILSVCFIHTTAVNTATSKVVYVSAANGDDSNDGAQSTPFKTFATAYASGSGTSLTIVLLDEVAIDSSFVFTNNGTTRTAIMGIAQDVTFDLSTKGAIGFYAHVTFKNITLKFKENTIFCANGKNIIIEESVVFNTHIKAFGGGYNANVTTTQMELYSGKYVAIYAGGYGASVNGNAKLTVGGNVNLGEGINDSDSSTVSQCHIYGGCYSGVVTGKTEINFSGNAVSRYIVGTGNLVTDTIGSDITINITGGKVMNVYGGSGGASSATVNNNIYIYMTGGLAESLFGGCEKTSMIGNTLVYVGGTADVSRRIFGGCYNNWRLWWDTSNCVTGSTTVIVDNGCSIASKTELSSGNQDNMGLFAGSRRKSNASEEVSALIFLNDCYNTYKGKIGDTSGWSSTFKSHHDYIVKAAIGGSVTNSTTAGVITLKPNNGNKAVIDNENYFDGETYTLSKAETVVTFAENIADYTVEHWIKNGNQSTLFKTEVLQGRVGSSTWAIPLNVLGHTAGYSDITIEQNGTVVVITYTQLPVNQLLRGDMNCDGEIDLLDAALLQRYLAEWDGYDITKVCVPNADINLDGNVDAADNLLLCKILANQHDADSDGKLDFDYSGGESKDDGWGPWV